MSEQAETPPDITVLSLVARAREAASTHFCDSLYRSLGDIDPRSPEVMDAVAFLGAEFEDDWEDYLDE